jgi:4-hydroxybenzoate polyprenyltransferase
MIPQRLGSVPKFLDVPGWQKWFGAAVVGFSYALTKVQGFSLIQLQGLLIGISMGLCYIQAVNDCFDTEIDRVKEQMMGATLMVSKTLSKRIAFSLTALVLAASLVSASFVSLDLLLLVALGAFLGTIYSAPPLRLKMKYPFSTLVQLIGLFIPFLAGIAILFPVSFEDLVISSVFVLLTMVVRFDHEIERLQVDSQTKKKTVAVVKGLKTAARLRATFLKLGIVEAVALAMLGLIPPKILILVFVYVVLCIRNPFWLYERRLPQWLKGPGRMVDHLSGLILVPISLCTVKLL